MSNIAEEVLEAQLDSKKLNQFITNYLPFIKAQVSNFKGGNLEYDDMLSLSMLTFYGCVQQYSIEKGNFLAFCKVCIKNRLLDESRKQRRHDGKTVSFIRNDMKDYPYEYDTNASIAKYNIQQEQLTLKQEIELFSSELEKFGVTFGELPRICPKQVRSRQLCINLATQVVATPDYYYELTEKRRLPQNKLASYFDISPKTIEKHRKYIVSLVILITGDYPNIQTFIPKLQEVI